MWRYFKVTQLKTKEKTDKVVKAPKKAPKKRLKNEVEDTIYHLDTNSYLERKKGSDIITLHRDGFQLDVNSASLQDFDRLYVPSFFENVTQTENLQIDKSLFYTNDQIHKLPRQGLLSLVDNLTMTHCNHCPINMVSDATTTFANYCNLSCSVGIEIQVLGAVFEQRGRKRLDRGKRTKPEDLIVSRKHRLDNDDLAKKEIAEMRELVFHRRLKTVKAIYGKLVSPSKKKSSTEALED